VVGALEVGVEDDDGDLGGLGGLDRSAEGGVAEGGEDDAADALGDEAVDEVDLGFQVVLFERAFPEDVDAGFLGGFDGAGVDGFPEFVRSRRFAVALWKLRRPRRGRSRCSFCCRPRAPRAGWR
jgi:hypothetical protein